MESSLLLQMFGLTTCNASINSFKVSHCHSITARITIGHPVGSAPILQFLVKQKL